MTQVIKTSIALTKPQDAYLAAEAARLGIAKADLIRRIIDRHRGSEVSKRPTSGKPSKPRHETGGMSQKKWDALSQAEQDQVNASYRMLTRRIIELFQHSIPGHAKNDPDGR